MPPEMRAEVRSLPVDFVAARYVAYVLFLAIHQATAMEMFFVSESGENKFFFSMVCSCPRLKMIKPVFGLKFTV